MRKRLIKKHKRIKKSVSRTPITEKKEKRGKTSVFDEDRCVALTERGITDMDVSAWQRNIGEDEEREAGMDAMAADEPIAMEKRIDIVKLVCGFVVVFSLLAAAALACFSFAIANKYASSEPLEETEPIQGESSKVVYVKPYDDGSGILTAPELYTKCSASVVSISVGFGSSLGKGVGSGFIVSEDGFIATAEHVIRNAKDITVITEDGKEYEARVMASDTDSDIALLRIDEKGLIPVEIGISSELLTGERVYAIGTPADIDYSGTLTSGEVSYPNRIISVYRGDGEALERRLKLIQTSVELNHGNSGCPLFDEYGRVVGMVTMKLGADYTGIGFAIPSDGLFRVIEAMKAEKTLNSSILSGVLVYAPRLGIFGENVELSGVYGYRITEFSDSSLSRGALKVGDVIVRIDNTIVCGEKDITTAINKRSPGDTVKVTVMRSGQRLSFDVVLGQ